MFPVLTKLTLYFCQHSRLQSELKREISFILTFHPSWNRPPTYFCPFKTILEAAFFPVLDTQVFSKIIQFPIKAKHLTAFFMTRKGKLLYLSLSLCSWTAASPTFPLDYYSLLWYLEGGDQSHLHAFLMLSMLVVFQMLRLSYSPPTQVMSFLCFTLPISFFPYLPLAQKSPQQLY